MTGLWIALLIAGASIVVLLAVAASGMGPIRSLQQSMGGMDEVREELERLRRNVDVLEQRRGRLHRD